MYQYMYQYAMYITRVLTAKLTTNNYSIQQHDALGIGLSKEHIAISNKYDDTYRTLAVYM